MQLYVIRRPSAWANLAELEAAGAKSARIGNDEMPDRIRWIRSYVVHEPDGRIGTFCIYQAKDGDFDPRARSPGRHARSRILPGGDHGRRAAGPCRIGHGLSLVRSAAAGPAGSAAASFWGRFVRPLFVHHRARNSPLRPKRQLE